MPTHYVLVKEAGVYVKEAVFFEQQGGTTAAWGKAWEPIDASNLHDARRIAIGLRRERYPNSHRTIGEDEPMEVVWPEATGH